MIYIKSFKLSPFIDRNPNAYPDHVFKHMAGEVLLLIGLQCCMATMALASQRY